MTSCTRRASRPIHIWLTFFETRATPWTNSMRLSSDPAAIPGQPHEQCGEKVDPAGSALRCTAATALDLNHAGGRWKK
jgi:hypothetical protein